jgi:hypothetical protein
MRLNPQLRAHLTGRHATVGQYPLRYCHYWPGYAVEHDLLGETGTEIRSDRANDT